jgi:hypothetical protein
MPRRFLLCLAACLVAACRSAGPAAAPPATAVVAPWQLASDDAPSQRLYRAQVRHAGERGSVRLVLRVWTLARFEVSASDVLGRPLWAVTVRDARGAWSTQGGRQACRLGPTRAVLWPHLGLSLPAADLAAVLLGRLPEAPAAGTVLPASDGTAEFLDGAGQRWRFELRAGRLVSWSLAGEGADLSWSAEDSGVGGHLAASAAAVEISWQEVTREPLGGTAPTLPVNLDSAPECTFDALP